MGNVLITVTTILVLFSSGAMADNELLVAKMGPEDSDFIKGEFVDLYFYQNRFFSFGMTIPGNWHVLSSKELLRLLQIATVRKGYGLTFQLSAGSRNDMTKLEDVLKSLSFE